MDYNYYRYKAGLNWDKFIKLHPEANGEEVFPHFMKRLDNYTQQRDLICDKFRRRFIDEKDLTKYKRIEVEKMYALAQLEHTFIDVLRVAFGLDPNDRTALFGDRIENRYANLVKAHMCDEDSEDKGLYIGADGLYRIAAFYDDDEIDISTIIRWAELKGEGKVYQTEEPPEDSFDIELFIDGVKVKLPHEKKKEDNLKKQLEIVSALISLPSLDDDDDDDDDENYHEITVDDPVLPSVLPPFDPTETRPTPFKPYPLNHWEETQSKITDYFAEYSKK